MPPDIDRDELVAEIASLQDRVATLSESIADCRADRLHQQKLIAELRMTLSNRDAPAGREGAPEERDLNRR
jgi:hypothetical protein